MWPDSIRWYVLGLDRGMDTGSHLGNASKQPTHDLGRHCGRSEATQGVVRCAVGEAPLPLHVYYHGGGFVAAPTRAGPGIFR